MWTVGVGRGGGYGDMSRTWLGLVVSVEQSGGEGRG